MRLAKRAKAATPKLRRSEGGPDPPIVLSKHPNLRKLRELRLRKPTFVRRAAANEAREASEGWRGMKYVYILESVDLAHFYVGITDDLRARLAKHNAVTQTSKYKPWQVKTYIAFSDEK